MITLHGKYNIAKVFTDNIDNETISQVTNLLNQEFTAGAKVRIMPDTHAGAGCVIGFTADLGDKVVPNLVGVDIGCGMTVVEFGKINVDLNLLDNIIHDRVPAGRDVHDNRLVDFPDLLKLFSYSYLKNHGVFENAIGTLGGGNHFIELDDDGTGNKYLVIHSGSRNLGKQVAEHYQRVAIDECKGFGNLAEEEQRLIEALKSQGQHKNISSAIKELRNRFSIAHPPYPADLCFLSGESREQYLHDMNICQEYASLNRKTMATIILHALYGASISDFGGFETIHNYIDFGDNIIRKGSISAYAGEKVIIPINMRDGSIVATGKGNPDWNFSAPHGAGRLMSRSQAKRELSLDQFQDEMRGVYTTTANASTLDEAPMAYKPMQEILDNIQDTVEVQEILMPVYNFKAGE